jgi:hypothetical protein
MPVVSAQEPACEPPPDEPDQAARLVRAPAAGVATAVFLLLGGVLTVLAALAGVQGFVAHLQLPPWLDALYGVL